MELFKPLWKSKNPDKRIKWIEKIANRYDSQNQKILADIAKNDKDRDVRYTAAEKVTDQKVLEDIARNDKDCGVRIAAVEKVTNQKVLADIAKYDEDESVRYTAVENITNQKVLADIAKNDKSYEVRKIAFIMLGKENSIEALVDTAKNDEDECVRIAAVEKVTNQKALADIAKYAEDENVRYAAVKNITDQKALADIAKYAEDENVRYAAVRNITDQKALEDIAKNDKDIEVRIAAVEKVTDQKILADIAKNDKDIEVREFAKEIIQENIESDISDFLEAKYVELEESRNSSNTEGLRKIAELGNSGKYKEAIKEAKLLLKKYPDLEYLYYWLGISYFGIDDYKNAHSILIEGLNKSRSKAYLCNKLGEIAWKSKNAKEALKWWCQAIHCHESNPHDLDNSPYLYLGAVAGAFGLANEYDTFMRRAISIRDASLSYEAFTDIQSLFIQQKTNDMHDILKRTVKLIE